MVCRVPILIVGNPIMELPYTTTTIAYIKEAFKSLKKLKRIDGIIEIFFW